MQARLTMPTRPSWSHSLLWVTSSSTLTTSKLGLRFHFCLVSPWCKMCTRRCVWVCLCVGMCGCGACLLCSDVNFTYLFSISKINSKSSLDTIRPMEPSCTYPSAHRHQPLFICCVSFVIYVVFCLLCSDPTPMEGGLLYFSSAHRPQLLAASTVSCNSCSH